MYVHALQLQYCGLTVCDEHAGSYIIYSLYYQVVSFNAAIIYIAARIHWVRLPRIETRDKNSSYIFLFRIVDPISILR